MVKLSINICAMQSIQKYQQQTYIYFSNHFFSLCTSQVFTSLEKWTIELTLLKIINITPNILISHEVHSKVKIKAITMIVMIQYLYFLLTSDLFYSKYQMFKFISLVFWILITDYYLYVIYICNILVVPNVTNSQCDTTIHLLDPSINILDECVSERHERWPKFLFVNIFLQNDNKVLL